ncbi:MAG: DUF935 family protein [Gammaproteobacteria bacterium]|nr:DUF935 family protein [Gammaproteobacteria bacterium]
MADDPTEVHRVDTSEVAGVASGIAAQLAPYIGEISRDPRQTSSYRSKGQDDLHVLQLYRDTLRDDQAWSTLAQRLNAATSIEWEVEPGGTMRADKKAAQDLQEQLERLPFDRICRQMLFGVWYGYSVAECMWKAEGSRVILNDIRVRAPDRFRWDDDREMLLRTWEMPMGGPVPPAKFWLLSREGEHGDVPHGPGLARWCYWPVWMRRNGHRFWAVALEKFGAPTPKGSYPTGDEASKMALLEVLRQLSGGAGIAVPEGQDVELLQPLRSMSGDFKAFPEYFDRMISKVILGQSSTTEQGPWRGTAEVQKDVRDEVVDADCRLLDESFNDQVARWLTQWNHPGAAIPKVHRDASPPEDLDLRAEREERISRFSGLRPTQKHVEETYGGEWEPKPMPEPMDGPGGDDGGNDPGNPGDARMARGDDPPLLRPPAASANAGGTETGEDGPVGEMAGQLRGKAGPLVDEFVDPVREFVQDSADSLGAVRDWIDEQGVDAIDTSAVVAVIGEALVAAELAGRYDTMESNSTSALATASEQHARLPFEQQVEFFRGKLNQPTAAWTDIWQSQHDRAFVVAGAAKTDLLTDLRSAVTDAIENGTTLEDFRKAFDGIVEKHGWSYNGGRDWRTKVIYSTNLRTSYAAGRYRQMKDMADRRPYWRYRHSHAVVNPRPHHLAWDGMILRHDDPWWNTHYPPNGWGCQCYVESLSERDMERMGKEGPDTAPEIGTRTVTVGQRGPHPRVVEVPDGIDPGWAYAPGQSLMRTGLEKTIGQAAGPASSWGRELLANPQLREGLHREFREWLNSDARDLGDLFVTGVIAPGVLKPLKEDHEIELETVALSATRNRIDHGDRDSKRDRGAALSREDLLRMPDVLAYPKAVLLDTEGRGNDLIYAFTSADGGGRWGKFVYRLNWKVNKKKKRYATNSYRSSSYVESYNLREPRYALLYGNLEEEDE